MSKPKQSWIGEDKDINWEVCRWECGDKTFWNTYLYIINKDMVDKLWTRKKEVYDWGTVYYPKAVIENLDWHGGQTLYHQIVNNGRRYIKVGDDYQHSWDEGQVYSETFLIENIKRIAEELRILLK